MTLIYWYMYKPRTLKHCVRLHCQNNYSCDMNVSNVCVYLNDIIFLTSFIKFTECARIFTSIYAPIHFTHNIYNAYMLYNHFLTAALYHIQGLLYLCVFVLLNLYISTHPLLKSKIEVYGIHFCVNSTYDVYSLGAPTF